MEEKEKLEFEAELNELGMILTDKAGVEEGKFLSIQVDLDTEVDYSKLAEQDFVMKKLTKRKDYFYIVIKEYDKERKTLVLDIRAPVSEEIFHYYHSAKLPTKIGTNFPDLCWYHAEGTTELSDGELETKFREDCKMGDLSWYLPSRMVDNFIEIMHTLNQSFLQGLMQETICYGPFFVAKLKE